MTVSINVQFDCTQREFITDLAWDIYKVAGGGRRFSDPLYFFKSQHPTERSCLAIAEDIFERLTGDSPSYDDEDEE